jgi:hypothetical protein
MDPRTAAPTSPDPDAVEFVRFCYRRRRVGWPELYDEMCAVAHRGLFRGYGCDDLAAHGIGLALFDMPRLAALAARVIEEERAARRPMQVLIQGQAEGVAGREDAPRIEAAHLDRADRSLPEEADAPAPVFVRLAVAAGA